jgi:hypothetical protein
MPIQMRWPLFACSYHFDLSHVSNESRGLLLNGKCNF